MEMWHLLFAPRMTLKKATKNIGRHKCPKAQVPNCGAYNKILRREGKATFICPLPNRTRSKKVHFRRPTLKAIRANHLCEHRSALASSMSPQCFFTCVHLEEMSLASTAQKTTRLLFKGRLWQGGSICQSVHMSEPYAQLFLKRGLR